MKGSRVIHTSEGLSCVGAWVIRALGFYSLRFHVTYLWLEIREWRNGVQLSLLLLPFFRSLLTKGKFRVLCVMESLGAVSLGCSGFTVRASGPRFVVESYAGFRV